MKGSKVIPHVVYHVCILICVTLVYVNCSTLCNLNVNYTIYYDTRSCLRTQKTFSEQEDPGVLDGSPEPRLMRVEIYFSSTGSNIYIYIERGSYMSAQVLLNLLNELSQRDIMRGLPSILSFFRNEFNKFNNTGARMLESIYHMTLNYFDYGRHNISRKSVNH